jgi:outer membrane lipopolysaccharide assembly protein LptE/RlpB
MYQNKNILLFIMSFILTSCGFEPAYKAKTAAHQPQSFKLIITGSNDQAYTTYKLRRELETLLPTISQKVEHQLTLKIDLVENRGNIAYNASAKAQRSQEQLAATVQIFDGGITPLFETKLDTATSYTVDYVEEFSTLSAESGARERLIKNLAQDIAHELSLFEVDGK